MSITEATLSKSSNTSTKNTDYLKVPFTDLPRQFKNIESELNDSLRPIFETGGFILGPAVAEFEKSFAFYTDTKYCVTVHSGTAALHLALMALDIGPGDEVITAANSFVATAEAIAFTGATIKLVDVDPITYNIDPLKCEQAISPKTKAIVPVHLYGQTADMDAIVALGKKYNVRVIEDACQAHGAQYKGRRAGSLADLACFSFYPGKNLGAAGEGGAVVTNNLEIAEKIKLLRNHGSAKKYEHQIVGHNFRLDSLQAAVLNVKLPYLDGWNEARRKAASAYSKQLSNLPGIITPKTADENKHVFHLYVIQAENRDVLKDKLAEVGIETGIHYPIAIHLQEAFAYLNYKEGDFPISEALSKKILSLPMFPELQQQHVEAVISQLTNIVKSESLN
jgi:dTDP-4-amino-4,6-dideoxygalactose transaminase